MAEAMKAGHDYGYAAHSPVTCSGFDRLVATACFLGGRDEPLRGAGAITEARVDGWYGIIASHDQAGLNYQYEIGLRHRPAKTNKTDSSDTHTLIQWPYPLALAPILEPPRFEANGIPRKEANRVIGAIQSVTRCPCTQDERR